MNLPQYNLSGTYQANTFQQLVEVAYNQPPSSLTYLTDGIGNTLTQIINITASCVISASYASNTSGTTLVTASTYPITSSWSNNTNNSISSSWASSSISSSYLSGSHTGSTFGTASWSNQSLTASYIITSQTASYITTAQTASYITSSNIVGVITATSASWASKSLSSSYLTAGTYQITTSWANNAVTSSYITTAQTASYITSSNIVGVIIATSASWASQSISSSFLFGNYPAYASNFILTGSYSNTQTGNYILSSSDAGKLIIISASSNTSVSVPILNEAFACSILQYGIGQVSITGINGVNIYNRANKMSSYGQYSIISIIQINTSSYILQGDVN